MVAIFMIGTLLFFLTLDYFIQRARRRSTVLAPQTVTHLHPDRFTVPRGYFFSPGHSWAELLPSGKVRVGIDDFLRKIVGDFDGIHVLKQESHVERGEPIMVLKKGKRLLSVCAPLSGDIIAVNEAALQNPRTVANDPYVAGWVLMIDPQNIESDLRNLTIGAGTARWLKKEVSRFRDFIRSCAPQPEFAQAGITMADGGFPLSGALQHADEQGWRSFEESFLLAPVNNPDQPATR